MQSKVLYRYFHNLRARADAKGLVKIDGAYHAPRVINIVTNAPSCIPGDSKVHTGRREYLFGGGAAPRYETALTPVRYV
ncbi:hypothetical protein GA0115259_101886 [Streptomyces sp. MnatMP-M17]|nr:hypothetical protein GA0115259_101886 [Streptomyces sp. MnatMP-M17]